MFDTEAEEIVKQNICGDCNKCQSHGYIGCDIYRYSKDSCLYGLRTGYNKANEWHDLRKDPKDLPNGYRVVLNQVGMATKYDPTRGFLGLDGIGVIAWREIPIFEKE